MAADLLSTIRLEIDERLNYLRPLLVERTRLLEAIDALEAAEARDASVPLSESPAPKSRAPRRPTKAPARSEQSAPAAEKRVQSRARPGSARRGSAAGAIELAASGGIARETILAALDHGSHTVGELAVVTAMGGPSINGTLRKLVAEGVIVKTEREGKPAWALPEALV